jgi:uracil phosphoribosyltransferase
LKAENYLNLILNEFPLDVASTQPIEVEGLKTSTKIFKVHPEKSPLIPDNTYVGTPYIIDSISGTKIACHPHIVGRNLKNLCLESANEFTRVLLTLGLSDFDGSAVLNILRAGSGYMVVEALPKEVPVINIRTEYGGDGYRAHSARPLRVTYRDDLNKLPSIGNISTLLVPDTFATGGSAEEALKSLLASGLEPKKIVIYGFTAIQALVRLGKLCSERDIELLSFSICNLTQLAHNNYDMPLYGFDESLYSSTGKLRHMGRS